MGSKFLVSRRTRELDRTEAEILEHDSDRGD
jgi:hypothetical protein